MSEKKIKEKNLANGGQLPPESEDLTQPSIETPAQPETRSEEKFFGTEKIKRGKELAQAVAAVIPSKGDKEDLTLEEKEEVEEIEDILGEGLEDVYLGMPADKQKEFKEEGEKIASRVVIILRAVKVKSAKIYQVIRKWLKIIPGINKFFLTQEAKIKTDKIIAHEIGERKKEGTETDSQA